MSGVVDSYLGHSFRTPRRSSSEDDQSAHDGNYSGSAGGQYQVGIGYLPINYPELETRELLDEDLMRCIPVRHRLFHLELISPQDLDREPLIGVSEHALPEVHKEITAYFEVLGIDLNVVAQP